MFTITGTFVIVRFTAEIFEPPATHKALNRRM